LPPGAPRGQPLAIDFEGRSVPAFAGESVAAALFAAGITVLGRSPKYHRPRGLFCLDGHCASCYLRIDGRPNQRACMTAARAGLRCQRQNAFPSADVDLLHAADWLFPEGMDHHTLMTGTRVGNQLFLKLVRQMGGSGTLPDEDPGDGATASAPTTTDPAPELCDVCVVGGGPAGLAAARAAAESAPGARVVLFDEQACPGGSLLAEPGGTARGAEMADAARRSGAEVVSGATAIAYYPEDPGADGRPGLLAVVTPAGLRRVTARRYLYATGSYDQNIPFPDNDRPGVISARACGRLAFHHGIRPVRPGRRVLILTSASASPSASLWLEQGLAAAGIEAERLDAEAEAPRLAARRRGDLIAVAALPAPASELPRQHGAAVQMASDKGGFALSVDDGFQSTAPGVHGCGDVTGFVGTHAAAQAGAVAGRAVAARLRGEP
jgi:sarcosine oxidase subunit alpha